MATLIPAQRSRHLVSSLINLEQPETEQGRHDHTLAKQQLIAITTALMPGGVPSFLETARYTKISDLILEYGKRDIRKALFLMVKDFCMSLNITRNMNQEQMIEVSAMLLDECGDFRMEDYNLMFAMAKRGQFPGLKAYGGVDIQYVALLVEAYWEQRHAAGRRRQQEVAEVPPLHPEAKLLTDEQMAELKKRVEDITKNMSGNTAVREAQVTEERAIRLESDKKLIELVERDAVQNIAPDNFLAKEYLQAIERAKKQTT